MPNWTGRWQHESSLAYYRGGEKGSTVTLISRFLFLLVGRSQVVFSQKDIKLFPTGFYFFSREWGKWEERIQHCSAWTIIFSEKLFYLIKHSVFQSKTFCGNMPVQIQRSTGRKQIFRGGELSSQEIRGKFQREIYMLQCSVLQLLVAWCQSQVWSSFRSGICSTGSGTYAFLVLNVLNIGSWGCWGGGSKPLKLLGRLVSEGM